MPPRSERVATMVQRELAKNPQIDNDVLREKAVGLDRGVRRLSARQFHTTYRLPALRSLKAASPGASSATASTAAAPTSSTSPSASPEKGAAPQSVATKRAEAPAAKPRSTSTAPAADASTAPAHAEQTADGSASTASTSSTAPTSAPTPAVSTSKAVARPHAAEREAVRQILQLVAREALSTEDRTAFVRLLDSLDERAAVILSLFGRA